MYRLKLLLAVFWPLDAMLHHSENVGWLDFFAGILFLRPKSNLESILCVLMVLYLILLRLGFKNWRYRRLKQSKLKTDGIWTKQGSWKAKGRID
jgi:hypothetical protein